MNRNKPSTYKFQWIDGSGHTGVVTRSRVARLLLNARSQNQTIHRINYTENWCGYQIGALKLSPVSNCVSEGEY